MEDTGLGDGADLPDWFKDGRRHVAVQANQGNSFGTDGGLPPAECEGRNIYAELAQGGAYLTNYAGFIAIAEVQNCAFELRFHGYPIDLQNARGAVVLYGAFHCELRGRVRGPLIRQH